MDYSKLFTPFSIGEMEVKNRLVLSPMGTNSGFTNGRKHDSEIDYFIERAKGGVGMIIMGCQPLNEKIAQGSMEGYMDNFSVLPALTSVVDGCHRYGAKIVCQITPGTGRNAFPDTLGNPPISASAIPSAFDQNLICHELSKEEIKDILEDFKVAATIAKDAGFDAIEVHAHAGYLIDQFMSSVWNKRNDEYGGSPENCARFPREIITAIRSVVGTSMPILFRISLDHRFEGGRTLKDSMPIIKELEKEGIDALDIDAGCYETLDYIFPPAYLGDSCMSYVCKEARQNVKVPLLNAGSHTPETALKLIESNDADFAMIGRGLIADPYLPNKLLNHHREDVRPCIRCNERCIGNIWNHHTKLGCSINVQAMEEVRMKLEKTTNPKQVVVIGGGPGGMEAARVAATIGHKVTLFEKSNHLGGVMKDIATSKFKINIRKLAEWYEVQLEKLNVKIVLNTKIDAEDPILENADHIIIGCGSSPLVPPIEGINGDNVITALASHQNPNLIKGDNIVICGGGISGCDGALEIASEMNKKVTIVEMMDECAKDAMFINKISLFNQLAANNVTILTNTKVISMNDSGLIVETKDGTTKKLEADTIISAFGMKPNTTLVNAIKEKYHVKTRVIGDSNKIGKIGDAVRDGYYAGSSI